MQPVKIAYLLGAIEAQRDFEKTAIGQRISPFLRLTGADVAKETAKRTGKTIAKTETTSASKAVGNKRVYPWEKGGAALGDPMFWQGGQEAMAPEGAGTPPPTAEEAALQLPPGIFQGLQIKVNPAGERSTSVKVTPDALQTPDTLMGIFQAEPSTKVEMSMPQATGESAGGGPNDMGIPQGGPVDGAGAMPPPKMAQIIAKVAEKTRIEKESNPDTNPLYPWNKKTEAERNAAKVRQMQAD